VSNPPIVPPVPSRGRPGGLLTPLYRCRKPSSRPRVICAPISSAFFVAYLPQIGHGMYCNFDDGVRLGTHLRRPHDQRRAVLDVVKALAAVDLRAPAFDDVCAQLEGSTYVMADEARLHFCVDRTRSRSYREDLIDAVGHPSAVSPDAELLKPTLSEQRCQLPSTTSTSIGHCPAISARSTSSRALRCRRHATSTLIVIARRPQVGARRAHSTASRTSVASSQRRTWSTSNRRIQDRSRSPSPAAVNCSARRRNR
jgi:hypothetical protein